jgi:hypothetical protein
MREWKEIGGLMFRCGGEILHVRAVVFGSRCDVFHGGDFLLKFDEAYQLYSMLRLMLEKVNAQKECRHCKHYEHYECKHPLGADVKDECRKGNRKHFEPKYPV